MLPFASVRMVGKPEVIQIAMCGSVPTSRLLVINRTTDNKRLYRDESGGMTSAF
jgi:hypothetical protein